MNRTHYFAVLWSCSPSPYHPGHRPIDSICNCQSFLRDVATRVFPVTVGPTTRSAYENRICLSLGFFRFRFHHRGRPFEFVYSGYSQSRSAFPLSPIKNPPRFLWEGSLREYVVRLFLHRASERANIFAAPKRAHILLKCHGMRFHLWRLSFGCVLIVYSLLFT